MKNDASGVQAASPPTVHTMDNGMTVLVEPMAGVKSAAMRLRLPAGAASDPVERCGSATVLCEMALRGAGDRDARQFTEHLDGLGLTRGDGVGILSITYRASGLAKNVLAGLPAHADLVRRPHLKDDGFGPAREQALQSLAGLEDNPQQLNGAKLVEWHWPGPFSRNSTGEKSHLEKLTAEAVRDDFADRWRPAGAILSVAGDVEADDVIERAHELFGDWSGRANEPIEPTPPPGQFKFIEQDSQQTHIGLAYRTLPATHADQYKAKLAVEVLSGGMSGRLFSEIREKKGLCYSVHAGYSSLAGAELADPIASVFCYAGTSNERAQATLDALVHELNRLKEGVTQAELDRARVGLKAGTVMSGESTASRASSLISDYTTHGRIRTLDEILAAVDAVTVDDLNAFLSDHPPGDFTVVLTGPKALDLPGA